MLQRSFVCAPTCGPVPHSLRVSSSTLLKSLIRLSKPALIDLALLWLQDENQTVSAPYLTNNRRLEETVNEDYLWAPAERIEELRLIYNRMRAEINITKRVVIDRMLDGDWRRGLSLYQVASIDFQYLHENDRALRWTALKLVPQVDEADDKQEEPIKKRQKMSPALYPSVSPQTFLRNLEHEISPLVKAHYYLHQTKSPQHLSIIRICVTDSPYTNPQSGDQLSLFTDPNRTIFIALPDSCPYIYISASGCSREATMLTKRKTPYPRMDITSLKRNVLEAIPRAISKSQHRYALESTSLTARSLSTMLSLRGSNGTNAANGVYTIFAKGVVDNSPIDAEKPTYDQKILQACQIKPSKGHAFSPSPPQHTDQRTALAEKSNNSAISRMPKSEEQRMGLKIAAAMRFGLSDVPDSKLGFDNPELATMVDGLDRLQFRLDEDLFTGTTQSPSNDYGAGHYDVDPFDQTPASDTPAGHVSRQGTACMTLTFQGSNIFWGIRKLVESGVIVAEKVPAWMTGEEAMSGGTVRGGIVVLGKGGGA